MDVDDFSLLTAFVRDRSEAAFRELVERHAGFVYSICRRRLRNSHLAEEVVQDVFLRLAQRASTLSPGPIRPFLFKVAADACQDIQRSHTSRAATERAFAMLTKDRGETELVRDHMDEVQSALDRMPSIHRDAIELRYIHGLSVPEVAKALQISLPAAQKRLVRGMAELKARLDKSTFAAVLIPGYFQLLKGQSPESLVDQTTSAVQKKLATHGTPRWRPRRVRVKLMSIPTIALATTVAIATAAVAIRYESSEQPARRLSTPVVNTPGQTTGNAAKSGVPNLAYPPATTRSADPTVASPLPAYIEAQRNLPFDRRVNIFCMPVYLNGVDLGNWLRTGYMFYNVTAEFDWPSIEAAGVHRLDVMNVYIGEGTILEQVQAVLDFVSPDHQLECVVLTDHLLIRGIRAGTPPATQP